MLKSLDNTHTNKYINVLLLFASLGALGLALYTLHDLQTAEGAGLYLSIISGQSQRIYFDILADLAGMLLLLTALLLPCLLLRHFKMVSFFRILSVYLAIMPVVRPGNVVHLSDAFLNMSLRPVILEGNLGQLLFVECAPVFDAFKITLPFLVLLFAINKSKRGKVFIPCILALLLLYLLVGEIAETTLYLIYYLLLIWCFAEWEDGCERSPRLADWSSIVFIGCLLRGIYRMLALTSLASL